MLDLNQIFNRDITEQEPRRVLQLEADSAGPMEEADRVLEEAELQAVELLVAVVHLEVGNQAVDKQEITQILEDWVIKVNEIAVLNSKNGIIHNFINIFEIIVIKYFQN